MDKSSENENNPGRYPMLMLPAFKDYIWGGDRLPNEFGKVTGLRPVAESWEVSCHPDGPSVVANGAYSGRPLAAVLDERPEWIAPGSAGASRFPILIKLIDARQNLSLQVHPNDVYARARENDNGKNEAWYIIDCKPGAGLIMGLRDVAGNEGIPEMIANGAILEHAVTVPVKPGDCYLVPAGLLHSICGGVLIAEVQQSSNVTYRVYDYGRVGADGKPRRLHVERAADVIDGALRARNCADFAVARRCDGYDLTPLADWPFFKLSALDIDGAAAVACDASFHALLATDGAFVISCPAALDVAAAKGDSVFIPAGLGKYTIAGRGRVLLATA